MSSVIKVENLSKQYRLGLVGASTIKEDAQRWWARMLGKEDPFLKLGSENDRTVDDPSKYVWSLKDLNFDVQQGDVLGVIGRNGAGKSTLLKILSKVTAPTIGSVKIKGRIASLLEVGTGFHPELTGRENIYLNGAILGMRKHEITRKLDEIIAFAGVEKYVDTPVKRYSSGMYVRLAFAVAAHLENEILIIDEVLAVGDAEFQNKCLSKIGDISTNGGRTIIFVSHNMPSVNFLCNRAILLKNGYVFDEGDTDKIINKYYLNNSKVDIEKQLNSIAGFNNIIISNVEILNEKLIFINDKFEVKIDFEFLNSNIKLTEVGVSIWSIDEIKLISLTSNLKKQLPKTSENSSVICQIENLNLVQGKYYLNAFISSDFGLEYYIEKSIIFEVIEKDVFGYGSIVDPNWGRIVINHNFILK